MNPPLTLRQAAILLDRHEITIRKAIAEGRVPGSLNPARVSPEALAEKWALLLTNPIKGPGTQADLLALARAARYPLDMEMLLESCEFYLRGLHPVIDAVEEQQAARRELVTTGD